MGKFLSTEEGMLENSMVTVGGVKEKAQRMVVHEGAVVVCKQRQRGRFPPPPDPESKYSRRRHGGGWDMHVGK